LKIIYFLIVFSLTEILAPLPRERKLGFDLKIIYGKYFKNDLITSSIKDNKNKVCA
jgi:hypothetical protein